MFVCGNTNNELFNVSVDKKCVVIREFFYNGESWYKLKDCNNNVFNSPTIFWNDEK